MIPLASDLLPFPGQMRREDHLKSASLPDRLSSSGRAVIVGTLSRRCPEALTASMDKITSCDRSATRVLQTDNLPQLRDIHRDPPRLIARELKKGNVVLAVTSCLAKESYARHQQDRYSRFKILNVSFAYYGFRS